MAQTINERFMDFQIAQQIKWIRLQNRDVEEALSILNRVDTQLESALMRAGIGDAPYTLARLEALKAQVTNLISVVQDEAAVVMTKNMGAAAEAAANVEEGLFRRELPAGLDITTPNLGVLQKAATLRPFNGAVMSEWTQQLKASDLTRTWNSILDGITSGTTTDDLIRRLLGTKALQYKDGVREVSRRGMEALVRTSINHATNQGRQMVWESNSDILKGVRWVSTLDTRTTPICQQRDGKVGPVVDDPNWSPPEGADRLDPPFARPPAHPNCRSTTTAVTKSWKELGFNVDELPAGTRASMDGQVPANMTYFEWLAKQSPERQKDILGPTRFDLWHTEGVKPERFVNDKGRLLTLDELRANLGKAPAVRVKGPSAPIPDLTSYDTARPMVDAFLADATNLRFLDPKDYGLKNWPSAAALQSANKDVMAAALSQVKRFMVYTADGDASSAARGLEKFKQLFKDRLGFDLFKKTAEEMLPENKLVGWDKVGGFEHLSPADRVKLSKYAANADDLLASVIGSDKYRSATMTVSSGPRIDINAYDSSTVKRITRTIRLDQRKVDHDYFVVSEGSQGSGAAKRILKEAVEAYVKMGIDQVDVHANIDVGGYAWVKYGFLQTRSDWDGMRAVMKGKLGRKFGVKSLLNESDQQAWEDVEAILDNGDPKAMWLLADSKLTINGDSVGKKLLLGSNWYGSLNLRDPESLARFRAYAGK